jgi:hypothetical protein
LILEASAAPKSIQNHPKFNSSTVVRTVGWLAQESGQHSVMPPPPGGKTFAERVRSAPLCAAKVRQGMPKTGGSRSIGRMLGYCGRTVVRTATIQVSRWSRTHLLGLRTARS